MGDGGVGGEGIDPIHLSPWGPGGIVSVERIHVTRVEGWGSDGGWGIIDIKTFFLLNNQII